MNWTHRPVLLFLLLCYTFEGTHAKDYCKEHEQENGGVGYCLNGGHCTNKNYGKECECMRGFKGDTCTEEIDECALSMGLCLNGGTCINKWGTYECLCTHGFEGQHCEINRDDCVDHACPDSKLCVDGVDSYSCECPFGRYGDDCEFEDVCVANNPCVYGNCSMISNGNYYCDCVNGFTGGNCDMDFNECEDDAGEWCINGKCENTHGSYKCHCDMGFQGRNCRDLVPHCAGDPCQNGGTCLNRYDGHTCICMPGFSGDSCEIRQDTSCNKECQHGGICYQRTHCMCPPAYEGDLCEIAKPNPCNHNFCGEHGLCSPTSNYSSYYCTCLSGYRGEHCQIKECAAQGDCIMSVDFCAIDRVNCSGRGRCLNLEKSHQCRCDDGYEGSNCDMSKFNEESNTNLQGTVLFFVTGTKENVIRHLRDIVYQMGHLAYVSARIVLDKNGHPKIYEYDQDHGVGNLVDTTNVIHPDNKDIVYGKTINPNPPEKTIINDVHYKGFLIIFSIDMSTCLKQKTSNLEINCPEDVVIVAAQLLTSINKVLEPLGIYVQNIEGNRDHETKSIAQYIGIAGFAIFGCIVVVGVLTIAKKKLHYRDRNLCTASIWTPPKSSNTKGFPGSMTSLNTYGQYTFNTYPQNTSTLTSIGASSINGSLTSAPREQLNKVDHDPSSLSLLHRALKLTDDQKVCEEVEEQLNQGADSNVTDSMGRTPLMFAVSRRGEIGIRLIDSLVSRGADVTRVDRDGLNVLHVAIESTDAFNERAALHLIRNYTEIDLNAAARSEETPLKICARVGDLTEMVVRALISTNQAEIDSIGDEEYPESRRRTALHVATEAGSVKIMELLLRAGAKVDAKDINEQTPLHLAAENMRADATTILLNYGADRNIVDLDNRTPEQVARLTFWQDGPRILNEPPSHPIEKKPAEPNSKSAKRGKRGASSSAKAAKKPRTKASANGASEALLPPPSTLMSPSSDSSASPPNNQVASNINTPYMYSSYPSMVGSEMQYQQMQHPSYYHQQQTPELMNNSVCSSDSQTLSPPMHPSSASQNINNSAHFNYNLSAMNGYPQNGYCYPNGMYPPDMSNGQCWYPNNYYASSSKVPSYSNGTNSLEFSPNSDQSMHNFGSPPDGHPNTMPPKAPNNPAAIYYNQSSHPTIV